MCMSVTVLARVLNLSTTGIFVVEDWLVCGKMHLWPLLTRSQEHLSRNCGNQQCLFFPQQCL